MSDEKKSNAQETLVRLRAKFYKDCTVTKNFTDEKKAVTVWKHSFSFDPSYTWLWIEENIINKDLTAKDSSGAVVRCACGCCHAVDNGACPEFEKGSNGRCAYCDHGEKCHNHKIPPTKFNRPL